MSELLDKDTLRFTEYAAELMVYFERHKLIEISKVRRRATSGI